MATIKDIANKLGVSVSTVSKGLNGASDISDELRQMVLDTAVEMGYSTKRSKKEENRKLCILIENMDYENNDVRICIYGNNENIEQFIEKSIKHKVLVEKLDENINNKVYFKIKTSRLISGRFIFASQTVVAISQLNSATLLL